MSSLLLLALLWLPAALVTDVCVRGYPGQITKFPKKALFYLITLPLVWLRVLEAGVVKVQTARLLEKVAYWFKS